MTFSKKKLPLFDMYITPYLPPDVSFYYFCKTNKKEKEKEEEKEKEKKKKKEKEKKKERRRTVTTQAKRWWQCTFKWL